ncbi:MAG: hypothetical protein NTV82_02505, partial [Candidatus Aminicenantes bacterium]|nr:hypothetical protein [Candidatus Aminicenantes bacterium]
FLHALDQKALRTIISRDLGMPDGQLVGTDAIDGPLYVCIVNVGDYEQIYKMFYRLRGEEKIRAIALHAPMDEAANQLMINESKNQAYLSWVSKKYIPAYLATAMSGAKDGTSMFIYANEWKEGFHEAHVDTALNGTRFILWRNDTSGRKDYLHTDETMTKKIMLQIYKILMFYNEISANVVSINAGDFVVRLGPDGEPEVAIITARKVDINNPRYGWNGKRNEVFVRQPRTAEHLARLLQQRILNEHAVDLERLRKVPVEGKDVMLKNASAMIRLADFDTVLEGAHQGFVERILRDGFPEGQARELDGAYAILLQDFKHRMDRLEGHDFDYIREHKAEIVAAIDRYLERLRPASGARLAQHPLMPDPEETDTSELWQALDAILSREPLLLRLVRRFAMTPGFGRIIEKLYGNLKEEDPSQFDSTAAELLAAKGLIDCFGGKFIEIVGFNWHIPTDHQSTDPRVLREDPRSFYTEIDIMIYLKRGNAEHLDPGFYLVEVKRTLNSRVNTTKMFETRQYARYMDAVRWLRDYHSPFNGTILVAIGPELVERSPRINVIRRDPSPPHYLMIQQEVLPENGNHKKLSVRMVREWVRQWETNRLGDFSQSPAHLLTYLQEYTRRSRLRNELSRLSHKMRELGGSGARMAERPDTPQERKFLAAFKASTNKSTTDFEAVFRSTLEAGKEFNRLRAVIEIGKGWAPQFKAHESRLKYFVGQVNNAVTFLRDQKESVPDENNPQACVEEATRILNYCQGHFEALGRSYQRWEEDSTVEVLMPTQGRSSGVIHMAPVDRGPAPGTPSGRASRAYQDPESDDAEDRSLADGTLRGAIAEAMRQLKLLIQALSGIDPASQSAASQLQAAHRRLEANRRRI